MLQSEASARMIIRVAAQSLGGKRRSVEPFDVELFELAT